jgi:hypothetical protein
MRILVPAWPYIVSMAEEALVAVNEIRHRLPSVIASPGGGIDLLLDWTGRDRVRACLCDDDLPTRPLSRCARMRQATRRAVEQNEHLQDCRNQGD